MLRTCLLALATVATACSSTAPKPLANTNRAPARYAMQPVELHDGQGMHSASQSWTTYSGALQLAADKATLELDLSTFTSFIHCPKDWDPRTNMQACASDNAKNGTTTSTLALDGFARWENGKLTITVRKDDTSATLTCDEKGRTLACSIDDDYTLFGHVGQRPQQLVFQRS